AAPPAAHRAALRRDRDRLLAAHPEHRAAHLLLHGVPDAAVPVLGRLLPAPGAALRRLAVGGGGAAAAAPGPDGAPRLPGRVVSHPALGPGLRARALGAAARPRDAGDPPPPRR